MSDRDVIDDLRALGLRCAPEALRSLLEHGTKTRMTPVETCEKLVELERRTRDSHNLARRTKAATLGTFTPIDLFDWSHPRSIDRALCERLFSLDFIEPGENVLLRGQSGVGKTTLAQNIGHLALQRGHTVRFTTLAAALTDLLRRESLPALDRRIRRFTSPDLWICDEIGYLPCDSRSADLLYNILSRRHERRSTIVTTNLAFKVWNTVFPGAACVGALVDRFAQHCHVVDIDADSWRQRPSRPSPARTAAVNRKPKRR